MLLRPAMIAGGLALAAGLTACSSSGNSGLSTPSLPTVSPTGAAGAAGTAAVDPGAPGENSGYAAGIQAPPASLAGLVIPVAKLGGGFAPTTSTGATTVQPVVTICGKALGGTGVVQRYAVSFTVPNGGSATVVAQTLFTYSSAAAATAALHALSAARTCAMASTANRATTLTTTLSHFTAPGVLPGSLGLRRSITTSGTKGVKLPALVSLNVFQLKGAVLSAIDVSGGSAAQELALFRKASVAAAAQLTAS